MPDNEENKTLDNLESVINDVVSDVAEPSPVADMPIAEAAAGGSAVSTQAAISVEPEKKKRGRPRKDGSQSPPKTEQPRPKIIGVQAPISPEQAAIEPCAEICVMMVNSSGMLLGGEAGAMNQNEALLAKSGFVAYFKAKGVQNVPPWVVLAGALAPYYLRVITTTPAKTTVASGTRRIWFGLKEWFKGRKNARSNRGNDTKRENDTSAAAGESSAS